MAELTIPIVVNCDDEKLIEIAKKALQESPNYVEVVRCRDCKWFAPNNDGLWIGCAFDTTHPDDVPEENDFCSYGERRSDRADHHD